jgi:hypothetical protein
LSKQSCRATGEYVVVPPSGDAAAMVEQGLIFCPKDARRVLKTAEQGCVLRKVDDVRKEMAAATPAVPETVVAPPAPVEATVEPRTVLYTTAPEDYDGFDARTEQILGTYGAGHDQKTYRRVSIPDMHVEWYRGRCGSGLHATMLEEEWGDLISQAFFRAKFTAAEDYTLPEATARVLPTQVAPHRVPTLRAVPQLTAGTPQTAPAAPNPRPVKPVAVAPPYIPLDTAAFLDKRRVAARALEEAKAAATAAKTALAAARLAETEARKAERAAAAQARKDHAARLAHGREDYQVTVVTTNPLEMYPELIAVIMQGGAPAVAALRSAIADGTIHVRRRKDAKRPRAAGSPRTPRPPTPPREPRSGFRGSLEVARVIRERCARGEKPGEIARDLGTHPTTISDIRDNRIWKEPVAASA